jgi:hypothetical protein
MKGNENYAKQTMKWLILSLQFFLKCRSMDIPITGPMLQTIAKETARRLHVERLSVLFCCSATGEKLKPLVIGNGARPRVFKEQCIDTKHLPINWNFNKKAWMTQAIFEEWLTDLNRYDQKRKSENLATC